MWLIEEHHSIVGGVLDHDVIGEREPHGSGPLGSVSHHMSSTGEVLRTEPRTEVHPRMAPTRMWSRSSAMRVHVPSAVHRFPGLDERVHRPALVVDVVHFVQLARWERLRLTELEGARIGTRTLGTADGGCPATSPGLAAILACRWSLDQVSNHRCSHLVLGHCLAPRHPSEP